MIITFEKIDTAQDLKAISKLFYSVFTDEPWNDKWESVTQAQTYLTDIINTPNSIGFMLKHNDEIIGMLLGYVRKWFSGDEFYLAEMCISKKHQRSGYGEKLLDYTEGFLKSQNVCSIYLLTGTKMPAHTFYKFKGFNDNENIKVMGKKISFNE